MGSVGEGGCWREASRSEESRRGGLRRGWLLGVVNRVVGWMEG